MSDSIKLPCGVVLERSVEDGIHWRKYLGALCLEARKFPEPRPSRSPRPKWGCSVGGGWFFYSEEDAMIKKLNEAVLETKKALDPIVTLVCKKCDGTRVWKRPFMCTSMESRSPCPDCTPRGVPR